MNEVEADLIPFSDIDNYMSRRADGSIVTDLNDPLFTDIEGY